MSELNTYRTGHCTRWTPIWFYSPQECEPYVPLVAGKPRKLSGRLRTATFGPTSEVQGSYWSSGAEGSWLGLLRALTTNPRLATDSEREGANKGGCEPPI